MTPILTFTLYTMYIDALIIFLIQGTNFTYRDDCKDTEKFDIVAYHRIAGDQHSINLCDGGYTYPLVVHELGHELYFRMTEKERETWGKLTALSKKSWDRVSKYAGENTLEDFAETFKYMYTNMQGKYTAVDPNEPLWIGDTRTKVLDAKLKYMGMLIAKYNTSLPQK